MGCRSLNQITQTTIITDATEAVTYSTGINSPLNISLEVKTMLAVSDITRLTIQTVADWV